MPPVSLLESDSTFMAQDRAAESNQVDMNHQTENPFQDCIDVPSNSLSLGLIETVLKSPIMDQNECSCSNMYILYLDFSSTRQGYIFSTDKVQIVCAA